MGNDMSVFRVGQKVVCVDDDWASWQVSDMRRAGIASPVKGNIYTVRSVEMMDGDAFILLSEIVNPIIVYSDIGRGEQGWDPVIFRPVVERKTDISIFKAMLNTTPETVGAA